MIPVAGSADSADSVDCRFANLWIADSANADSVDCRFADLWIVDLQICGLRILQILEVNKWYNFSAGFIGEAFKTNKAAPTD